MRISDWSSDVCSSDLTNRYIAFMEKLAVGYNINIVGGSHPTRVEGGDIRNIAYVFRRDGSCPRQAKLNPTPSDRRWGTHPGGTGADAANAPTGTSRGTHHREHESTDAPATPNH